MSRPRPDQIADDDQAGRNTDAGLQRCLRFQAAHCCDQLQRSAHRPLGVILVRLWIPKVHENAIAHELRYEPTEPTHSLSDAFLIGRNDFAKVFGVHARR